MPAWYTGVHFVISQLLVLTDSESAALRHFHLPIAFQSEMLIWGLAGSTKRLLSWRQRIGVTPVSLRKRGQLLLVTGHPKPVSVSNQFRLLATFLVAIAFHRFAQTNSDCSPNQAPGTASQTEQVLSSYERQNVVSVELVGQPDASAEKFL
jgi:hypothetical protein